MMDLNLLMMILRIYAIADKIEPNFSQIKSPLPLQAAYLQLATSLR